MRIALSPDGCPGLLVEETETPELLEASLDPKLRPVLHPLIPSLRPAERSPFSEVLATGSEANDYTIQHSLYNHVSRLFIYCLLHGLIM